MSSPVRQWVIGQEERRRLGFNFRARGLLPPGETLASVDSVEVFNEDDEDVSDEFGTLTPLTVGDWVDDDGNVIEADVVAYFWLGEGEGGDTPEGVYRVVVHVTDSIGQELENYYNQDGDWEHSTVRVSA